MAKHRRQKLTFKKKTEVNLTVNADSANQPSSLKSESFRRSQVRNVFKFYTIKRPLRLN